MASYVAIYPQPVAYDEGHDPNVPLGLIIDDGTVVKPLGDLLPMRSQVMDDIERWPEMDMPIEDRLTWLARIYGYLYRVEGPIQFEGKTIDVTETLERLYFA